MRKGLIFICVCMLCVSVFFFYKAYDVKSNYYNSENYTILNKNAYVGGDAYNYIINGTYFTGYSVIGSVCLLGSIICMTSSAILSALERMNQTSAGSIIQERVLNSNKENEELPPL